MKADKLREVSGIGNTQLKNVLLIIERTAGLGRDNCYLYDLTGPTIKELKKLGYIVESGSNYGEYNCHMVRW